MSSCKMLRSRSRFGRKNEGHFEAGEMYRLNMLSLTSSTIEVKLWRSMMESPGKRSSVEILMKVRE